MIDKSTGMTDSERFVKLEARVEELEARTERLERLLKAHAHAVGGPSIVVEGEWPNHHGVKLSEVMERPLE